MASSTLCEMVTIFNSQTHIDDIYEGITGSEEHRSDEFTFMLPHKHFDLSPGEVLFVEKTESGYNVTVEHRNRLDTNSSPCMWLYASGWKPFGYTKAELGYDKVPNVDKGNYNIGVRWLNNGGTESTNDEQRVQWVRTNSVAGESVTTLVNWEESSDCISSCQRTGCVRKRLKHISTGHIQMHERPPKYSM